MVGWAEQFRRFERWALPAECSICLEPISDGSDRLVCTVCALRWRGIGDPRCARCGEPMPLALRCRVCIDWPPDFGPVQSAVQFDPAVRQVVHRFKYQGWHRLAEVFAARMSPVLDALPPGELVPIPLSRRRERQRGYNQSAALARALAAQSGRRLRTDRLDRVRDVPSQTRLAPEARRANLADAFTAVPSTCPAVLVDDVFTTGATLAAAAAVLLDAGAPQVMGITFARASLPLATAASRLSVDL